MDRIRRHGPRALRLALSIALGIALCVPVVGAPAKRRGKLLVSCAASMRPAIEAAADGFREKHPEVDVAINAAASGVLLQQVLNGAAVDLMISASPAELDTLEEQRRIVAGSRRGLASNRLVIVVPRGATLPRIPHDLIRPEYVVIAIGNPRTAPLGRYTTEALQSLGLLDPLGPHLIPTESARHVMDYVARGEVDAGIVYATDAALFSDRVATGPAFPADAHSPVRYEGAVIDGGHAGASAGRFLEFLVTGEGRAILADFGFGPPG